MAYQTVKAGATDSYGSATASDLQKSNGSKQLSATKTDQPQASHPNKP